MITFDSFMLKAFFDENKDFIISSRISKIQQPTRREVIIYLRNKGETKPLYINIDPKFYHLCFISSENYKKRYIENPKKPPMFCMLLRKYLNNAKVAKINQPENERILELYIETFNEIGDKIYLCLAIELMGKYSNIILYNTDTNIILGCAHNVGSDKSQIREVYGQIPYIYPPKNNNQDFINCRYAFLNSFNPKFYQNYNINSVIDNYYAKIIQKHKLNTLKSEYSNFIGQKLKNINKTLIEMQNRLKNSNDFDKYRLYGDLLMGNLFNLNDYTSQANVFDYENNKTVSISLNPQKTIKDNAGDYYKKYNKSKTAKVKLEELYKDYLNKKNYFEDILYSINASENLSELMEIEDVSFTKSDYSSQNQKKELNYIQIKKDENTNIYIGKNNKQNDYIISKLAAEDDLWFHVKDYTGSHVLLKSPNVTDELIFECAKLAKKYSSVSNEIKIGVIYTKRKYIRKVPKSISGFVTYHDEKEIVV